jgi:gas vesicle protein
MPYQRFYPQQSQPSGAGSFLSGLVAGVLIGVVAGILLAPHRGEVTRRKIVRQAGDKRDEVIEAVEDLVERRSPSNGDQAEE